MGNRPSSSGASVPRQRSEPVPRNVYDRPIRTTHETPSFTLILVRHGVSCANLKKTAGQSYTSYKDPELTRQGQEEAIQRGFAFRNALQEEGITERNKDPIVGASILLRAQQTAFFMMSPDYNHRQYLRDILVVPYVSEMGLPFWGQIDENRSVSPELQDRILREKIYEIPRWKRVYRPNPLPEDAAAPSPAKFIHWMDENYGSMSIRAAGQYRPLIVFTHGYFIQAFIKHVVDTYHRQRKGGVNRIPTQEELPNYSAFRFQVYFTDRGIELVYRGPFDYGVEPHEIDYDTECSGRGDECHNPVCTERRSWLGWLRGKSGPIQPTILGRPAEENEEGGVEEEVEATEAATEAVVPPATTTPPIRNSNGTHGQSRTSRTSRTSSTASNMTTTYNVIHNNSNNNNSNSQAGGRRRTRRIRHHKRKTHKRRR